MPQLPGDFFSTNHNLHISAILIVFCRRLYQNERIAENIVDPSLRRYTFLIVYIDRVYGNVDFDTKAAILTLVIHIIYHIRKCARLL